MQTKLITKQRMFLGGLLVILVISSFHYTPVKANGDENDEDGVDDNVEEENERAVDVEYSSYEVQITSSYNNNGVENDIQIQVKVGSDGLGIDLEFDTNNNEESEMEFKIDFTEIIEFRDLTGEGAYNETDDVAQTLKLDNFKPIDYSVDTIDNTSVHVLFIETIDEIFTSTLYISSEFVNVSGIIVAPTQMKIDIGIHNFNFNELDTQLALKMEMESEKNVNYNKESETEDEGYGYAEGEYEIGINFEEYKGFFSWVDTVIVDDIAYNVTVTPFESSSEDHIMYFCYPRGTEIIHDPKIGMEGLISGIEKSEQLTVKSPWVDLLNPSKTELLIVSAISLMMVTSLVLIFRKQKHTQV